MKNNDYIIDRNSIYFGILVENKGELCTSNDNSNHTYLSSYKAYRPILFKLDENNQANDLLNDSPNYPVLNHSPINLCHNSKMIIIEAFCLDSILKYFGYLDLLYLSDVISVRNKIFTYKFLFENSRLFGYERISPCDITKYDYPSNHLEELTPEQKIKGRKIIKIKNYYYAKTNEGIFLGEIFEILNKCANYRLPVTLWGGNFNPTYDERTKGNVRRLRRI